MKKFLIVASALALSCGSAFAGGYAFHDGSPENNYVAGSHKASVYKGHKSVKGPGYVYGDGSHENKYVAGSQKAEQAQDNEASLSMPRFGDATPAQ